MTNVPHANNRMVDLTSNDNIPGRSRNFERSLSADGINTKGLPTETGNMLQNDIRLHRNAWNHSPSNHQIQNNQSSHDELPGLPVGSVCPPRRPQRRNVYENLGHRRVRSGDAAIWSIHSTSQQNIVYPSYTSNSHMTHATSMIDSRISQQSPGYLKGQPHYSPNHGMVHSVSMDMGVEHCTKQTTKFIELQNAIEKVNKVIDELTKDIEKGERELNALLTAESPTEAQYIQISKENDLLLREVDKMYKELDQLNNDTPHRNLDTIHDIPGASGPNMITHNPNMITHNAIKPADLTQIMTEKNDNSVIIPQFPDSNTVSLPQRPIRKSLPTPPPIINQQPPPYRAVNDPAPPYREVVRPPVPPRPLQVYSPMQMSEHWVCPKCTFENLLVGECEVCLAPRPVTLNRPH